MTKAQIKGLKTVAYKGTLRNVEAYKKAYSKGRIMESKTISTYAEKVKRYLNNDGTLKEGLTARQVANFNKLVDTFKNSEYSSVAKIREVTRKAEATFIENHAGATQATVKSIRDMIIEANQNKIKLDSAVAIALADEMEDQVKITNKEFMSIFEEYIQRKKKLTPREAGGAIGGDDTVKQIQSLLEIYKILPTEAKKDELVDMIKNNKTLKQMQTKFAKDIAQAEEEASAKEGARLRRGKLELTHNIKDSKKAIKEAKASTHKKGKATLSETVASKKKKGRVKLR